MNGLAQRIVLLGLVCQVVSTVPNVELPATTRDDNSTAQTAGAIPESSAGLQSQLEAILRAVKDRDPKQFDDLINDLQIPESANWFATTFGEEIGQNLAALYKSSWKDYEDGITNMFRDSGTKKHTRAFVKEFSASTSTANSAFIQAILQNTERSLALYTAGAGKNRESDSLPGVYVYVQGKFRVVNWRTFYDLPNVKPVRIRVSAQVAQAQLLHQVNPVLPPESHQRVHGTVVLHVVIDRDGNVAQVEAVSGPQELVKATMAAVRQWRYKPTLLNGDPVEVDTTITIVFALENLPHGPLPAWQK